MSHFLMKFFEDNSVELVRQHQLRVESTPSKQQAIFITVEFVSLETLRLRFFDISREPGISRNHVTSVLASGFQFEVHVCTARTRSRGK